ncbi:hypothetical protein PLESTM_002009000 [Pleodorina starrii]|nr:hypothetical protein PLESTM_002009000 [Pleodorina starrii]
MDGRVEGAVAIKQEDHASGHWHNFPAGLRLLVVDDDPLCLKVVEQMLRKCSYEVTTCTNATMALNILRDKSTEYDLVLSDVYMPDMDGFKLLEVVGLEMDLPVIMMSSNGDTSNVLRGVTHGACDYLIKPVRLEELRNLWQHVVRRRRQLNLDLDSDEQSQEREDDQGRNKRKADAAGFMSDQLRAMNAGVGGASNGGGANGGLAGGSGGVLGVVDDLGLENGANKKARVVWSVEMHQQFVNAVNQLGIDKAVPKKILEIMNVDGLTRENVASHLQKYRLYLKRVSGVQAPPGQARAARPSPPQPQSPSPPSQPQQPQQQQPMPGGANGAGAAGGGGSGPGGLPSASGAAASLAGILSGGGGAGAPLGGGPIGADGGAVGPGLNSAVANAMSAAAAAGGFPGHPPPPPHPAALLAANPMMAAAAGLNPLLGAMGGLGVGPLGSINPLNGMPMPGMQPPLGLLPGLAGPGGQSGLGHLGPMGLPGLGHLPSLPGGLSLNSMANGLQQMAAANLMQGMAAGMGQLPALAMNGLMGPLPGVGLPGPQQHMFTQQAAQQQLQQQLQQKELQQMASQKQQQQQQQAAAAAAAAQPHAAAAVAQQQQQQPGMPKAGVGTPSLASPAPVLLQQPLPGQHHPHALVSPSPHLNQNPHPQQQPQQQDHQQQLQLQTQHSGHLGTGNPLAAVTAAGGLNGAIDAGGQGHHLHVPGPGTHGIAAGHGVPGDAVLDITPEMMGGLIEDGFGAAPGGPAQATHGSVAAAVLDPAMLLDEGDNLDLAAVYNEMYHSGGNNAGGGLGGGGSLAVGMGHGGLLAPPPVTMVDAAAVGLAGGPEAGRMGVADDDFLNFLLKN